MVSGPAVLVSRVLLQGCETEPDMPTQSLVGTVVDRHAVMRSYLKNRARSQSLFDLLDDAAYYERPIPLRHPVVFYEGHIPAFSVICFLQRALGHPGIDPELDALFARGIDPGDEQAAAQSRVSGWPDRSTVQAYAREADRAVLGALEEGPLEGRTSPALYRGQGVFTALEHEIMHQETLLYMWHRFEPERKTRPASLDLDRRRHSAGTADDLNPFGACDARCGP